MEIIQKYIKILGFYFNIIKETNSIKLGIRIEGDLSVIPEVRKYRIVFRDTLNEDITVDFSADEITVDSGEIMDIPKESPREIMINLMSRWQKDNLVKMKPYAAHLRKAQTADEILAALGKCGLPVSVELGGTYGLSGLALSIPTLVGKNGAQKILELPLNVREKRQLQASAAALKGVIDKIGY